MNLVRIAAASLLPLALAFPPATPATEPGPPRPTPAAAPGRQVTAAQAEAAAGAAGAWLALIDAGKYAESWTASAGLFRGAIDQEGWVHALKVARVPLGALVKRSLTRKDPQGALPGAPDGDYVVLTFQAAFAKKASAVETVTFTLEPDGRWRAAGYYIR
jgi:hypothetical protein